MGEPRRPEDEIVEFDFDASDGLPATPPSTAPSTPSLAAEDDPFTALAGELSSTLAEDEGRTRRLAGDEQRRLAAARVGGVEMETLDPAALEQSLRADLLATDTASASGPRFIDVRATRTAPRFQRPGVLRRLLGGVATLLSTGADQSKLPRVFAGYLARTLTGALAVALIVGLAAGPAGSAFDATYAPEAALVRHTGGIVVRAAAESGNDNVGMLNCDEATGVALQLTARRLLDTFDAAVLSGDMALLAASFATPEAAAPWVADASDLHTRKASRVYESANPRTTPAICDAPEGGDGLTLRFGGLYRYDLKPDGSLLAERPFLGLLFTFTRRGEAWELDSARFLEL